MKELFDFAAQILPDLFNGLILTVQIGICAFLLAVVIGFTVMVVYSFRIKWINSIIRVYVSFYRGTPLLMQIFLFYYGAPMLISALINIPKFVAIVLCMAVNSGAYIFEIFRGAVESVDIGQYEASIGFGMTHFQALRRIIFPQAIVAILPALTSSFLDMLKVSSIGMTIGIQELTGKAQLITAQYYKAFETYFIAIILYWILSLIVEQVQRRVELWVGKSYQR